jgi:hypothetical protein
LKTGEILHNNKNYLESLLTSSDCAKCKLCCYFSKYEIGETPMIGCELRTLIENKFPQTHFIDRDDFSLFVLTPHKGENPGEFFDCPVLTETGCALGSDKPFECAVWPFRIMKLDEKYVISVSTLCPVMLQNSLDSIIKALENGLEDALINYAAKNPAMIKKYMDGYPIIKFINDPALKINILN